MRNNTLEFLSQSTLGEDNKVYKSYQLNFSSAHFMRYQIKDLLSSHMKSLHCFSSSVIHLRPRCGKKEVGNGTPLALLVLLGQGSDILRVNHTRMEIEFI